MIVNKAKLNKLSQLEMCIHHWVMPNILSLFKHTGLVLLHAINYLSALLQLPISFSVSIYNRPFTLLNLHCSAPIFTLFIAICSSVNAKNVFINYDLPLCFPLFPLFPLYFNGSGAPPFYPAQQGISRFQL